MATKAVCLAAFLLCLSSAHALQCYSCDSSKGQTCAWGLLSFSFPKQECNPNSESTGLIGSVLNTAVNMMPTRCMKLVGRDHEGNEYIARGCTAGIGEVNACQIMASAISFGAEQGGMAHLDCHTCDTDLCNSATRFNSATAIATGVIAACLAFMF